MPRFVRPSFVKINVDGRKAPIATGPDSRTGEMSASFLVRSKGEVLPLLEVDAIASKDGMSVLYRVTLKASIVVDGQEVPLDKILFEQRFEQ